MNWLGLVQKGERILEKYGIEDPRLESEILLSALAKRRRLDLYIGGGLPANPLLVERFDEWLDRRGNLEPIQYITGSEIFLNRRFSVGPGVLIPRPETEGVVRAAVACLKEGPFLELGVGSGCVAISILLEQQACREGYAVDLSPEALRYARANSAYHEVTSRLHLLEGDLFSPIGPELQGRFEIVVSNPPYLDLKNDRQIEASVRQFEPMLALDGGLGGLDYYKRILKEAVLWLKPGGHLILEMGMNQVTSLAILVQVHPDWKWIETLRDDQGIERILILRYQGDSFG
jgi:release factor glutamine methyltransferase